MITSNELNSPLALPCGAVLPNRIAKSGMSEQLASRDGRATDKLTRLYGVWSNSGAGLLITGNAMIDRAALTEPGNVILDDARGIAEARKWTSAAKAGGAQIWLQINHPGRVAVAPLVKRPVAPSPESARVPGYNFRTPRALTMPEIREIVAKFARTASLARSAGFDGVQIHGAHGYLLSQFLSPSANLRDDEYGGNAEHRRRLLLEVVEAVRTAVGPAYPIGVKLNSSDFDRGGFSPEESLEVAKALEKSGVDLLEISGGNYEEPAMTGVGKGLDRSREAYFADFASLVRKSTKLPLMLTGGIRSIETMKKLVGTGTVDVIGIARPMAFVPDYPARVLAGEEVHLPRNAPATGYRPLDGYLDLAWHNNQFHRMARGLTPQRRPGVRTLAVAMARIGKGLVRQTAVPR